MDTDLGHRLKKLRKEGLAFGAGWLATRCLQYAWWTATRVADGIEDAYESWKTEAAYEPPPEARIH